MHIIKLINTLIKVQSRLSNFMFCKYRLQFTALQWNLSEIDCHHGPCCLCWVSQSTALWEDLGKQADIILYHPASSSAPSSVTSFMSPASSSSLFLSLSLSLRKTITPTSRCDSSAPYSDSSYFTSWAWSFWAFSPPWWTPSKLAIHNNL